MTSDHPIRFRNFADEDDSAWTREEPTGSRHSADTFYSRDGDAHINSQSPPAKTARPVRAGALLGWGAALALVGGVAIALSILPGHRASTPEAATTGPVLKVHRDLTQPKSVTSTALLPCYVNGSAVGSLSLADCARHNGVASGRLDVGLQSPTPAPAAVVAAPLPPQRYAPAYQGPTPAPPVYVQRAPPARPQPMDRAEARLTAPPVEMAATPRDDSSDRPIDVEDSMRATRTFYEGLAEADGGRAASVVVPEKRGSGPLSAGSINRFYSDLREPLRLTRLYPLNDHTVVAHYAFVDRDGGVCEGTARVTTTQRDGEVYVQGVRALNGC